MTAKGLVSRASSVDPWCATVREMKEGPSRSFVADVDGSLSAVELVSAEANVPYQHAFDALNALVVAYEDPHAAEALRVRLRKYEGGTTPMADAPMLNALLAIISYVQNNPDNERDKDCILP